MAAAVFTTLAVAPALTGCSSGSTSSAGTSAAGSEAVGQGVIPGSDLASALDLIPDMHDGNVRYAGWPMLGHRDGNGPDAASFAGAFLAIDTLLQRDLGIGPRTRSGNWTWTGPAAVR